MAVYEKSKSVKLKSISTMTEGTIWRQILLFSIPLILGNLLQQMYNTVDSIIVGNFVGSNALAAVGSSTSLICLLIAFSMGASAGAGVIVSQFYGAGDENGVQRSAHTALMLALILGIVLTIAGIVFSPTILRWMRTPEEVMNQSVLYLRIYSYGLVFNVIYNMAAGILNAVGNSRRSLMYLAVASFSNIFLDLWLIGGMHMGVEGAAIATVLSRYVELGIITVWSHTHTDKVPYIKGVYRTLKIPKELTQQIVAKGLPLILNEALWAFGIAILNQCYSTRGLAAVAGINISSTITNLFNVVFIAMGSALAIIVGQLLGAGKLKEAKETDTKLIFASVASCFVIGTIMAIVAPLFPQLYNTTDEVKELATFFIIFSAFMMPFNAFLHSAYFTLRSGGKTLITFFFDAGFVWIVSIPLAMMLSRLTDMPVRVLYACCTGADLIKVVIGYILVKRGKWVVKIVDND